MKQIYRANGKIMLTGEYAVLYGARALALPINRYQQMEVEPIIENKNFIYWQAKDMNGVWFEAKMHKSDFSIVSTTSYEKSAFLKQCLEGARALNHSFLSENNSVKVLNLCNFDIQWGFGSSSTLIANIARWAHIDPFELHRLVSAGSGYDIACALSDKPIIYSIKDNTPIIEKVEFKPPFLRQLNLVYSGRKQNTAEAIKNLGTPPVEVVKEIDHITLNILNTKQIDEFMQLIAQHEKLVSQIINQPRIKDTQFNDFDGEIKSLGAWGGDFMLVASKRNWQYVYNYFKDQNYMSVFPLEIFLIE